MVTTASLPAGQFNQAYSATLSATGGDGNYTWELSGGTLPQGLTLGADGVISGAPTWRGTFNITVRVRSGDGQATSKSLSIIDHLRANRGGLTPSGRPWSPRRERHSSPFPVAPQHLRNKVILVKNRVSHQPPTGGRGMPYNPAHEDLLNRILKAFDTGDADAAAACYEPDAIYHLYPEVIHGREGVKLRWNRGSGLSPTLAGSLKAS